MSRPTAALLAHAVREGSTPALEVVEQALEAAGSLRLGAFLYIEQGQARQRARALDAAVARGEDPGPLAGVPLAIKANLCWSGRETHCGSRLLAGYRPPYDATAVARALAAGAVPIGTTNMDEFGMGSSSENSAYGPCRNPWDANRTPGGSSGGSAVAVAAGVSPLALGSDTGGSVRQPAALCGVVGYKPSYGTISRHGLVAFASSLDQVGCFARSVADAALLTQVLAGPDGYDATTTKPPTPWNMEAPTDLRGVRIGVLAADEDLRRGIDEEVWRSFERTCEEFEALGAERVEIPLPSLRHAIAAYYVLATAEASSNLARFDGVRFGQRRGGEGTLEEMFAATRGEGFGAEVQRRILLGTYVLRAGYAEQWYGKAGQARALLSAEFRAGFERCDVLVTPTTTSTAFLLGSKIEDPLAMYAGDLLTVPVNLAGLPAISVPCGLDGNGLPLGLQMIGPKGHDARLLSLAACYEAQRPELPLPPTGRTEA